MLTPAHIELYCRIKSDPFRRGGFDAESAVIFCEKIDHRLAQLDEFERTIVLLLGCGYTQGDIARMGSISLRTMVRRVSEMSVVLFAELSAELGKPVRMSQGRRAAAARKAAA